MNLASNPEFHKALVRLRELSHINGGLSNSGICLNLRHALMYHIACSFEGICEEIADIAEDWPEYSGDRKFPVPSPKGSKLTDQQAYSTLSKWNGEYGRSRLRLLDFLIQRTQTLSSIQNGDV